MANHEPDPHKHPVGAGSLELIGGVLCLAFTNTLAPRAARSPAGGPTEYLTSYDDLLDWSLHAHALDSSYAARLRARATVRRVAARAALSDALALREAIYRVCVALAKSSVPAAGDLAFLSTADAGALENAVLMVDGAGVVRGWAGDPDDLTRPLWPVARSASEWLLTADTSRIKECPPGSGGCGRLFYDTSKNNSRRWCSMRTCGGLEKERRRAMRRAAGGRQGDRETGRQGDNH